MSSVINWKIIKHGLALVRLPKGESIDIILILLVIVLFGFGIFFYNRQKKGSTARRIIQIASLTIFGFFFSQCLCIIKDTMLGFKTIFTTNILSAIVFLWLPAIVVISVLLRKEFYCYWICPLGFFQELCWSIFPHDNVTIKKCSTSKTARIIIFTVLAISIAIIVWAKKPSPFIMAGGALLGFALPIILMLVTLFPTHEMEARKGRYIFFVFWVIMPIVGYKLSGPWCVIGKANLGYVAIVPFICIMICTIIITKAWCNYICPDGTLFQLMQWSKQKIVSLFKHFFVFQ